MKLAVIQVRGFIGVSKKHKDGMTILGLRRKNSCVLIDNNANNLGALVRLKDYVTWGEANIETFKMLLEKRGRLAGNKTLSEDYLKKSVKQDFSQFCKNFFEGKIKLAKASDLGNESLTALLKYNMKAFVL